MNTAVNLVDVAVIAVVLLSSLLAFFRGFVTETLSVASWVGAGLVTLFGYPLVLVQTVQYLQPPVLAEAATIGGVFVISLGIFTLISHQIGELVRGSALGAIDRSLGFLFGMARGALLVVIAYAVASWVVPPANQPVWLREARSVPMAEAGAKFLLSLVPEHLDIQFPPSPGPSTTEEASARNPDEALRLMETTRPQAAGGSNADPGITIEDRNDFERVLDSVRQ